MLCIDVASLAGFVEIQECRGGGGGAVIVVVGVCVYTAVVVEVLCDGAKADCGIAHIFLLDDTMMTAVVSSSSLTSSSCSF